MFSAFQEGKTWLSIALSKEEAKESSEELDCSFQTALQYAEKAQDAKLQVNTGFGGGERASVV